MRFESQLALMNCQTFSCGLSSGLLAGSGMMEMFGGTISFGVMCHPAWSTNSTAWAPGATACAISARWRFIVAVLHQGRMRPAALPSFGQMAPKI